MRCRLLLSIIVVSVSLSVCLSHSLNQIHSEKLAEWIQILFVVNSLRVPRNSVLDGDPDTQQRERGEVGENLAHCKTAYIFQEQMKVWVRVGSRDLL